jgi:hypothetical protein
MTSSEQTSSYRTPAIPQAEIDRAVANGRRLRSEAVREMAAFLTGAVVRTILAAAARRAVVRLRCAECGRLVRA